MRNLDLLLVSLTHARFRSEFPLIVREKSYLREKIFPMAPARASVLVEDPIAPAKPLHDGNRRLREGIPCFWLNMPLPHAVEIV